MNRITITPETTVGGLVARLQQLDPDQRFLTQAILPDGTAHNAPAVIGEVGNSNCGDGKPYLYIQIRCDSPGDSS